MFPKTNKNRQKRNTSEKKQIKPIKQKRKNKNNTKHINPNNQQKQMQTYDNIFHFTQHSLLTMVFLGLRACIL